MGQRVSKNKWCRRRYIVLVNRLENKAVIMDSFERRYQYMRQRISEWSRIMDLLKKELPGTRLVMVGLTVAKVGDYKAGMIRDYVKELKRILSDRLYGFAWVAELQERGAVHYHLLACIDKSVRVPMPDKSGMWKWGSSNVVKAKTAYYICSYIGKERQKDLSRFPKSCRTFAVSYRLPEGQIRDYYESLKDIEKHEKIIMTKEKNKDWDYVGSTVTYGFANEVLLPADLKVR